MTSEHTVELGADATKGKAPEQIPPAWLEMLAPAAVGRVLGGRMVLDGFDLRHGIARLRFRDLAEASAFVLRLRLGASDTRRFARAGRIDVTLDCDNRRSPAIERFTRALADRWGKNAEAWSEARLAELFPDDRATPSANPYQRRHSLWGAAQINLRVGSHCNEACVFCTDTPSRGPHLHRDTAFWIDVLAREYANGRRSVLIVGNEPTLRTDLPTLVSEAQRLGYLEIELSTNGVRLSDRVYLAELLDAGLNVVSVSVHGATADLEGRTTGRPEFHARRFRGFENFVALVGDHAEQERREVYLRTVTVLTTLNLAGLPALVDALDPYHVTYMLFHYPWIHGDAASRFEEVVPTYTAVAKAVAPLVPRLADPKQRVGLANLPACVVAGLGIPGLNFGRTVFKNVASPERSPGVVPVQALKRSDTQARDVVFRSRMDPSLTYADGCQTCAVRTQCPGIPTRYLDVHGPLGINPIKA